MRDSHDLSRRDFFKTTAAAASVAVTATSRARASTDEAIRRAPAVNPRIIGANDRIHVGIVGVKGMGGSHLRNIVGKDMANDNAEVVAICDVWETARQRGQKTAGCPDSAVYVDYRQLLANNDVDAVVVATPDHWHGRMGVDTLLAGKHLYIEKPMTRYLDEAFQIYDAAKRTGRLVQVGSHGCSDPKWHRVRDLVKAGAVGRLLWAQGSYCRNNPKGEWNYELQKEATADTIDWTTWLGPAKKRPWSAERYFRWRKYWDYGTGIIGDLWPHRLHPLMLAMNLNEFPQAVSCMGSDLCSSDGNGEQRFGETREVADTTLMTVEFPCGVMITLAGATVNERGFEDIIRGQKANLRMGGGRVQVAPERPFVDQIDARDETPPDAGETHVKHMRNFFQSIRNNVQPNCNVELGIRVQAVVSMAEIAYRKRKLARFDLRDREIRT